MGKRSKQGKTKVVTPAQPAMAVPAGLPADAGDPPPPALLVKYPWLSTVLVVALWIYVAALCLLALDQWFGWGIFGPKPVT